MIGVGEAATDAKGPKPAKPALASRRTPAPRASVVALPACRLSSGERQAHAEAAWEPYAARAHERAADGRRHMREGPGRWRRRRRHRSGGAGGGWWGSCCLPTKLNAPHLFPVVELLIPQLLR